MSGTRYLVSFSAAFGIIAWLFGAYRSYFTAIPGLSGTLGGYWRVVIHRWRVRFIRPYPVSSTTDYNYFYSVAFYPPACVAHI